MLPCVRDAAKLPSQAAIRRSHGDRHRTRFLGGFTAGQGNPGLSNHNSYRIAMRNIARQGPEKFWADEVAKPSLAAISIPQQNRPLHCAA